MPPIGVPAKDMPPLGVKQDPIPLVKVPNADTRVTAMQAYSVQEADTLPIISQRSYGSDKYASALLAFNRAKNKDALVTAYLQGNTPRLVKGMELIIPPPEFLSANYGQLIQESAAAKDQVPFSIKPPTAAAPPPLGAANPNAGQLTKANTSDPTRRYRVPDQGQYVIDIAAKSLNNPNRWVRNPSAEPQPASRVPHPRRYRTSAACKLASTSQRFIVSCKARNDKSQCKLDKRPAQSPRSSLPSLRPKLFRL